MADIDTVKFLVELRQFKSVIPKQAMKTLKGQALSGDLEGAKKA